MADRFLQHTIGALLASGAAAAALLVAAQSPFADSRFEYQMYRDYEGRLEEQPYPVLLTGQSRFLLVAPGKHGASDLVRGLGGRRAHLKGALIRRGEDSMLELLPGSIAAGTAALSEQDAGSAIDLGIVTLSGEIVDSKCFFGVMNPGNGKVHRDCAVRCISGGIPPALLVRDETGKTRTLLLTGTDGRQVGHEVLDFVAEPVTISGRLRRQGAALILQAEPKDIRRE